jgi:sarcosine oxidase / L-pipecolate oxidase
MTRLVVDPEGEKCVGVEVGDTTVRGKTTIVCTGAWTPSLLEKSKIVTPPGFFQVTAVGVAVIELSDSEFDSLKSMPILVTENGKAIQPDLTTADIGQGEAMLSKLYRVIKGTTTETFRVGDPDRLSNEVDITPNRKILEKMLPQFKGRELKRFCCP